MGSAKALDGSCFTGSISADFTNSGIPTSLSKAYSCWWLTSSLTSMGLNMPQTPARDLSKHFGHAPILALAGVSVKGAVPDVTRCPFCTSDTLCIMPDPMSGGATWLHCGDCGFCGDTIELYCKMHNQEIREGIYRAISDGVAGAITDINDLIIGLYIEHYPEIRAKHQSVWKLVNGHVVGDLTPEIIGRIQADHLWTGWRGNGRDRFAMCLGAARRKEIVKFFPGEREIMPRDFRVPLVVNYQDVPGRISAFHFIGESGELSLKVLGTEVRQQAFEGGLAMLDFLRPFEGTVFAVGNPMVALHLHKLNFMDSNLPAKIICYNECTNSAWQYVNAKKVVFWDDEITWRIFDQAKRVQNAEIAVRPNPRRNEWHTYFADTTVDG